MRAARLVGIILIVLGAIGLVYDRVTYVKERHDADIGPLSIHVDETKTVPIPMWAGIAAIVAGLVLVAAPARKLA